MTTLVGDEILWDLKRRVEELEKKVNHLQLPKLVPPYTVGDFLGDPLSIPYLREPHPLG